MDAKIINQNPNLDFSAPEDITHASSVVPTQVVSDWPDAIPFEIEAPPGEAYPLDALGPTLTGAARAIHLSIKSPGALCGQAVLAAANLACAGHVDVEIDGRRYPNTDFLMSVGVSGERKSATDNAALLAHREFEKAMRAQYKRDKKVYDSASSEDKGDPPPPPLLALGDVTMEGIQEVFAKGVSRIGICTTEAGNIIGGHSMKDENRIRSGAVLSSLWDGQADTKARAGAGLQVLCGRRLTAHLGCQPVVAASFLGAGDLRGQGLTSRLLVAWPESTIGSRTYQSGSLADVAEFGRYLEAMTLLLKQKLPVAVDRPGELEPEILGIAPGAKALWIQFHDGLEKDAGAGGRLFSIQFFACKAAEHALRLASILSSVASENQISQATMTSAIELVRWYVKEWLRIQSFCRADSATSNAQILLTWLRDKKVSHFVAKDVYQKGPSELRVSAKVAHNAIEELQARNFVRLSRSDRHEKRINCFDVRPDA